MISTVLDKVIERLTHSFDEIGAARKLDLEAVAQYISSKQEDSEAARVTVICTHNSRRSHIGQLWLSVAANHFGVLGFESYSGGTEATAFNHRSVSALRSAGFELSIAKEGENPVYHFSFGGVQQSLFSKVYDHSSNPSEGFAALLVCDSADKGCPVVAGADARFFIGYTDPKVADDTSDEAIVYYDKVLEIGREMLFLMSLVRASLETS